MPRTRPGLHLPLLLSLLSLGGGLPAQSSRNYKLLGTYSKSLDPKGKSFAGVAAFRDAKGGEFALLLDNKGTQVLDLRDPAKPKLLAQFPGPPSVWRSACVLGGFGYVVSEGGAGVQILDLRDPAKARLAGTALGSLFRYAHSVVPEQLPANASKTSPPTPSRIAILGTDTGSHLLSLSPDPSKPTFLGTWKGSYLLNGVLRGTRLYACAQWNGSLEILDFSTPSQPKRIAAVKTARAFPEGIAISQDESLGVVTDSHAQGGALSVFALAQGGAPKMLGSLFPPGGKALGGGLVLDRGVAQVCFVSEGLRMLDLGTPRTPKEIAHFDPWKGSGTEVRGVLAVARQPFSNRVYALDPDKGLSILSDPSARRSYGTATVGWEDRPPLLEVFGSAWTGTPSFRLSLSNARPSSPAFLLLGSPGDLRLGELRILIDPLKLPVTLLPATTNSLGALSRNLSIPAISSLGGLKLGSQVLILDRLGAQGFSASQGLSFGIVAP
ncbi:MAG TPA: hypothetical protein ENK02_12925 [Planctomycetes bacterium]|nr:hypothetical protein [Planctomycetota bacterium]